MAGVAPAGSVGEIIKKSEVRRLKFEGSSSKAEVRRLKFEG
jgi:hypothetical protein